ncbi:unnamed protein product, partial [Rotaria sp. Silwood2]
MAVSIDLLRYEKKQQISHTAIGSTMGHEITHGFDIIGRQYDENGNVVPWWINEKIDAYNKQIECFIQQYKEKPMDCFRVIGSTSNFIEFDRVFSCKPGQSNSRPKQMYSL